MEAISNRRSIRKYLDKPVPKEMVEAILQAGMLAPSSKNRQPWRFIVVSGEAKAEMRAAMEQGFAQEKETPMLPSVAPYLESARHTKEIMAAAPVTIFILNTEDGSLHQPLTLEERVSEICNTQSIGAAIENMTLTATELGLGSLWICDTFFAYDALLRWLGGKGQLTAALAVGYAAESPVTRPRKSFSELVQWRS